MHILCPHIRNPVELIEAAPTEEILRFAERFPCPGTNPGTLGPLEAVASLG
jgi:hypothetical protein